VAVAAAAHRIAQKVFRRQRLQWQRNLNLIRPLHLSRLAPPQVRATICRFKHDVTVASDGAKFYFFYRHYQTF
jgi:hypothetical protein